MSTQRGIKSIKLTKELIAHSRVIAKGKRIRDVERLVAQYGGQSSKWVKKSSPIIENKNTLYEYHWYEHYGTGRFEIKLKVLKRK
ncbi:MAG: hypothetical protein SVR94_19920 [Pseudomonadota bacterium]|nr:hypothetical protein [Pseudomonadota bacterium]